MKFFHFLLFCSYFFCSWGFYAQTIGFVDNFNDRNLTQNPAWQGEINKFDATNAVLQLNDSSKTSPAILYLTSEVIEKAIWEFDVQLGFAPSGSNYAKIYLAADHHDPSLIQNGYFIQVGGQSGSVDDISLYKINNGTSTKIIDGKDGTAATNPNLKIKTTRDPSGTWELFTDTSATGNFYFNEGSVLDTSLEKSSYFVIECIYTSTRSDKFFFDNFLVSGEKYTDTIPPKLISAIAQSDSSVLVTFSEKLNASSLNTGNFTIRENLESPNYSNFYLNDSSKIELYFPIKFTNGASYTLEIQNITDKNSNILANQNSTFNYFVPDSAGYRDVVINEIYADENPSFGLPEAEFIEIFNASNKIFDLKDWVLEDANGSMVFSSDTLRPGEYLILCSSNNQVEFASFGKVQAGSFPNLTNVGELLHLKNETGKTIDKVNYSIDWYGDDDKKDGGYSLEQINPFAKCNGKSNFAASHDASGGTPGSQNSIFDDTPDTEPPEVIKTSIINSDSIAIFFNEPLDSFSIEATDFSLENHSASFFWFNSVSMKEIHIKLLNQIDTGKTLTLSIKGIHDCEGNGMRPSERKIILPFNAQKGDIVINEILFNPRPDGYDFVEIYNRSNKVIGLDKLFIANLENGQIANAQQLSIDAKLLYPGEYFACTENSDNIIKEYPRADVNFLYQMNRLPPFNNDAGTVFLIDGNQKVIDSFSYFEDMHFELLNDLNGVSLERVNPHRGSGEKGNFQSAAESEGFATPGYLNSQYFVSIKNEGEISVDPELFSPDNDGYHDVLHINYNFGAPNYVANITIFDKYGRTVRSLIKNELLGNKGSIIWNGLTDENEKADIGIYIIYFEAFNTDGSKMVFKETCVVAGFLD